MNTKKALELKHVCGYLPYDLKGKYIDEDIVWTIDAVAICTDYQKHSLPAYHLTEAAGQFLPYLRSIHDLTKQITHKGETFVPLVELAKINWLISPKTINEYNLQNGDNGYGVWFNYKPYKGKERCFFLQVYKDGQLQAFTTHVKSISDKSNTAKHCAICVKQIMDKLHEWMFDIRGLIDEGLAIPVTEDFNHYK